MKLILSEEAKINQIVSTVAGAAASTEITSSAVNMAGFESCLFIVTLGPIVTGAATSIKLQQSSDDGSADDYTDLTGTGQTIADDAGNTTLYVNIHRPQKQYLKLVVSRATQNATIGGVTAIQYNRRSLSTASHGTNVSGESHASPAEGTA